MDMAKIQSEREEHSVPAAMVEEGLEDFGALAQDRSARTYGSSKVDEGLTWFRNQRIASKVNTIFATFTMASRPMRWRPPPGASGAKRWNAALCCSLWCVGSSSWWVFPPPGVLALEVAAALSRPVAGVVGNLSARRACSLLAAVHAASAALASDPGSVAEKLPELRVRRV